MNTKTKKMIRIAGWILFIIYLLLLVYMLFLSEEYGRKNFVYQEYHYNLIPFQEIRRFWVHRSVVGTWASFLNLAGNVIGFVPFGFILPIIGKRMRSGWLVGILGFCLSLFVESVQLVCKVGCFDVDDLMLNTLGAVTGYILFAVCNALRRWIYEKKI